MKRLFSHPWRFVFAFIGCCLFFCFFFPVFGGIIGIANLCGMALGLILLLCSLRWVAVSALLKRLWKSCVLRVLLSAAAAVTLFTLVLLTVLCCRVIGKMDAQPTREGTLIVLGCQVRGEVPSLLLSYRIDAAAKYLTAHPDECAILSGGRGPGEGITEAECMYRALLKKGIAAERLYLEDRSHTTLENLQYSSRLMAAEGLPGPAVLVSSDFHIYRASEMARELGLDAEGLAAHSAWYSCPTYVLREAMALVKYGLMGS